MVAPPAQAEAAGSTDGAPEGPNPVPATTQHAPARRAELFCTYNQRGEEECISLTSLPSRALIERTLAEYASTGKGLDVQQLRCEKNGSIMDAARARRAGKRKRAVRTDEWSLSTIERAEQNILALLRSCHATDAGLADPIGLAPTEAAPLPVVMVGAPANRDALDLPTTEAGEAANAGAHEGEAPSNELTFDEVQVSGEATAVSANFENAASLPSGVRLVHGYSELRPAVTRLVIVWEANVPPESGAHALNIDPCADPIGMPAFGECEQHF
ncbi:MAG: hypothetical protein QM778_21565 [Myxococcales bacterium]